MENEVKYSCATRCADGYAESRAEYLLPDYLGDVRKILYTNAAVHPGARFMGDSGIECSGIVVYDLIYLDSDGNIGSVQFSSDYDYTAKCSAEECSGSVEDVRLSNFSLRPSGPRKISARASVVGNVRVMESKHIRSRDQLSGARTDAELNSKRIKVRQSLLSERLEREYAESVALLDSAIADEVSVVYSDAKMVVESVERSDEALCLKGKLHLSAVVKNGDMGAIPCNKTVNVEEILPFDEAGEDAFLIPYAEIVSVKADVNPEESGCSIVLSCVAELYALAERNELVERITDGYFKECESSNTYESVNYTELAEVARVKGSHSAELSRAEIESGTLREMILFTSSAKIDSVKGEGDLVRVMGEITYSGIASEVDADGRLSYAMVKFSSPFVTNVNISCQNNEKMEYEAKVITHSASAGIDAENIYASCAIEVFLTVCEEKNEHVLTMMSLGEPISKNQAASITVYYPDEGDTLFSVAKRFRSSAAKLATDNGIDQAVASADSGDPLSGVKRLIVY